MDTTAIQRALIALGKPDTLRRVMKAFDWQLQKKGYIPMSGRIVDASLVPAPKQRNMDAEKEAIKAGRTVREIWSDEPNKAAQKDVDAYHWPRSRRGETDLGQHRLQLEPHHPIAHDLETDGNEEVELVVEIVV